MMIMTMPRLALTAALAAALPAALLPLLSQETPLAEVLVQMGISHARLNSIVAMVRPEPERASMTRVIDRLAA